MPSIRRSEPDPIRSNTVIKLLPNPRCVNIFATRSGVCRSALNTNKRAPGYKPSAIEAIGRFVKLKVSISAKAQPRRAQAKLKADAAGITVISEMGIRRDRVTPIP